MATAPDSRSRRPNILLLLSDQHNADVLGARRPGIHTPNLDRLAGEGALYTRAYCQAPLCAPARFSLLTERYVAEHGVSDNAVRTRAPFPTAVQAIKAAAYHTAAIGKMHLCPYSADVRAGLAAMERYGFREVHEILGKYGTSVGHSPYTDHLQERGLLAAYSAFVDERNPHMRDHVREAGGHPLPHWSTDPAPLPSDAHPDAWVGQQVADWIEAYDRDEPFFLWAGFPGPHDPWDAPSEFDRFYDQLDVDQTDFKTLPARSGSPYDELVATVTDYCDAKSATPETMRRVYRRYCAGVTLIDEYVGRILDALEGCGILDNTWVIYTSDHGELLGSHGLFTKWLFYDAAVRVPLIIRPPGGQPSRVEESLVEHVDVLATIRAIARAGSLPGAGGRSLLPTAGPPPNPRGVVQSECHGFGMWRTERFKIVVEEESLTVAQLFDLERDPQEQNDVKNDPSYTANRDDLMRTVVEPALRRRSSP